MSVKSSLDLSRTTELTSLSLTTELTSEKEEASKFLLDSSLAHKSVSGSEEVFLNRTVQLAQIAKSWRFRKKREKSDTLFYIYIYIVGT